MDKKQIHQELADMELRALDTYLDYQGIGSKEYVNEEIMGILEYQTYVELYYQAFGECYECEQSPCDEGCPYQVNKLKESENENEDFIQN
jgi:hypothetical protein